MNERRLLDGSSRRWADNGQGEAVKNGKPDPFEQFGEERGSQSATSVSLLWRVRNNDQQAWTDLVRLYTPLVAYWCRRGGAQPADVDDLMQEVFGAVAGGIDSFRRDREHDSFRAWIRGIARNKVLEYHRRRRGLPQADGGTGAHLMMQAIPAPNDAAAPDLDEPVEMLGELYHRACELIRAEFTHRAWLCFWRTAVDGQPANSIAEELNMSAAAVRMAKSRVLRRLREEVGDILV